MKIIEREVERKNKEIVRDLREKIRAKKQRKNLERECGV